MVWLEFLICSALLTYFAYHLCKEGVILSEKTRMEAGLIGMFFLAVATSFPEVVTGATAVFYLGRIGLGYGDIVGSVIVNLMVLFFLDYYQGKGRILLRVTSINRITGVFVVIVVSAVLFFSILRLSGIVLPAFKGIGIESPFIVLIYFASLEIVRRRGTLSHGGVYDAQREPFWGIWAKFIFFLVIVMFLGVWMAKVGEKLVITTEMSQTFIGTLFLGLATSLPEIIVSFAALKAGSVDMAVGNILGSNLFDVAVIPFFDGLSRRPILGMLTSAEVTATIIALLLSAVAVMGLFYKRDTNKRISWDTSLIFVVGFIGFVLLYFIK